MPAASLAAAPLATTPLATTACFLPPAAAAGDAVAARALALLGTVDGSLGVAAVGVAAVVVAAVGMAAADDNPMEEEGASPKLPPALRWVPTAASTTASIAGAAPGHALRRSTLRLAVPSFVIRVIQPCSAPASAPSRAMRARRIPSSVSTVSRTLTLVPIARRPTSGLLRAHATRISGGLSAAISPQYGATARLGGGGGGSAAASPPPPPAAVPSAAFAAASASAARSGSGAGGCQPSFSESAPATRYCEKSFVTLSPSSSLSAAESHPWTSAMKRRQGIRSANM